MSEKRTQRMIKPLDYFASLVQQGDAIPLFDGALSIAQDKDPALDLTACMVKFDTLALQLKRRLPADVAQIPKLRLLNQFFYQELGFADNLNDYYDPNNSYLHKVLLNRCGIPISLAVIYMELTQQVRLIVREISFPSHFLMKLSVKHCDIILDPFNGASLSHEELEERLEPYFLQTQDSADLPLVSLLEDAQPRVILVRMLRNLKALYTK